MPYHIIPYHVISYHIIPCHTIPCHTIPYHVIPYLVIPYLAIPYHTIPHHTIPRLTIPYHTTPYHTIPCHTIPCHTIPCHTIPYHTMSYHTVVSPARHDIDTTTLYYLLKKSLSDNFLSITPSLQLLLLWLNVFISIILLFSSTLYVFPTNFYFSPQFFTFLVFPDFISRWTGEAVVIALHTGISLSATLCKNTWRIFNLRKRKIEMKWGWMIWKDNEWPN